MTNIWKISTYLAVLTAVTTFAIALPEPGPPSEANNSERAVKKDVIIQERSLLSLIMETSENFIDNLETVPTKLLGKLNSVKNTALKELKQTISQNDNASESQLRKGQSTYTTSKNFGITKYPGNAQTSSKEITKNASKKPQTSANNGSSGSDLFSLLPSLSSMFGASPQKKKKKHPPIPTHNFTKLGLACSCQTHQCNCFVNALQLGFESSPYEIGCNVTISSFGYKLVTLPINLMASPHVKMTLLHFLNKRVQVGFDIINLDTLIVTNTACVQVSLIIEKATLIKLNLGCLTVALDNPFKVKFPDLMHAIELPGIPHVG